jgi:hypothetical protein
VISFFPVPSVGFFFRVEVLLLDDFVFRSMVRTCLSAKVNSTVVSRNVKI